MGEFTKFSGLSKQKFVFFRTIIGRENTAWDQDRFADVCT